MQKQRKIILLILIVSFVYKSHIPYDEIEQVQAEELAKQLNYPTEYHEIYTKSGYMLSMLRIQKKNQDSIIDPYKPNKNKGNKTQMKPVLFLHGLSCDMNAYFASTEENISPFLLANEGFDVWLANFRGTSITQKHLKYTINDDEFWDFDIFDYSNEDLPDIMKFIGEFTNQKIDVVTFSMGGSVLNLALASQAFYVEHYIGKAIEMCPGLQPWKISLIDLVEIFFNPDVAKLLGWKARYYNTVMYHQAHILPHSIWLPLRLFSEGNGKYDYSRVVLHLANFPSSLSYKVLEHLVQMKKQKKLQKFDYGKEKNLELYGTEEPEQISPENFTRGEIHIFHGMQDQIVPIEDSEDFKRIAVKGDVTVHKFEHHGHCSFTSPKDEYSHLEKMVQILSENKEYRFKKYNDDEQLVEQNSQNQAYNSKNTNTN